MFNILILAAVIPAVVLLVQVYKEDHVEKEPVGLLVSLVVSGIFSTFLAVMTERFGTMILNMLPISNKTLYNFIMYFVVVALSEEGFKYVMLKKCSWYHPAFNYLFDGIIYGIFVSLGFALWENILYTFNYGLMTALVRAVTAVPGHACFGVFMGLWYGLAKKAENRLDHELSKRYRILAVVFPVLIHGFYDFCLVETGGMSMLFLLFILILFTISLRTIHNVSNRDDYIGRY